jgi:hypothetical protein
LIFIYKKLTRAETKRVIADIEAFFAGHPRRRVCHTDLHGGTTIRRGHATEDVLAAVGTPDVRISRTVPKASPSTRRTWLKRTAGSGRYESQDAKVL